MSTPRRLPGYDPHGRPLPGAAAATERASQNSLVQSYKALTRNGRLGLGIFLGLSGLGGLWVSRELEKRYPPPPVPGAASVSPSPSSPPQAPTSSTPKL